MIATEPSLEALLERVRPAVRAERAYVVGAPPVADVKLNQNESPFDLPADLKRELAERFLDVPFNRYPAEQPEALRAALAERLGLTADWILVGNGSNELTYTLGLCLIERGTPVVMPRPMFSLYEKVVRLFEGDLTAIAPRDDLSFDAEALEAAVRRADPALTVLTTPNNPTGLAMSTEEVERIVAAASGFVVVDEAYVEFHPQGTARPLLDRYPNVILMRTFSKASGLAGLRLGYLVARPEVIEAFGKSRLPFMVDRLAEQTALALLERPELVQERIQSMHASTEALYRALRSMEGVEAVPTRANFVIFRTGHAPGPVLHQLARRGVLVRDVSSYPELDGYLRVAAGTPDENRVFLAALQEALRAA